ncbi:RNA-binding protein, putative [Babesia caballi]|uniref:RNA-binding protein, putative n=1 Tax=Babesia caballi TaxID=5871 RepID=A0AAV4LQF5_BABCB|nr:RNA-binding protein, putative [Babesia caballi]
MHLDPHASLPVTRSNTVVGEGRLMYIHSAASYTEVLTGLTGSRREFDIKALDYSQEYGGNSDFIGGIGRGRRFPTRGEKRRAGKMGQEYRQIRPESPPWITEDFGGIPSLPHKTPIELSADPINEEFLEMRKRKIPHSLLKDHYMLRMETEEEVSSYDDDFQPLFKRSPSDKYLYLLGDGITPQFESVYDVDFRGKRVNGRERLFGARSARRPKRGVWEPSEPEPEETKEETDENVKFALEQFDSYNGRDRICQLFLSALKDYQDANLALAESDEEGEADENVIDKELAEHFMTDGLGAPIWLSRWNAEYLRGRADLEGDRLIEYDNMWYGRLEKLYERHEQFLVDESPVERIVSYFEELDKEGGDSSQQRHGAHGGPPRVVIGEKVLKAKWSEHIPSAILETIAKYSFVKPKNATEAEAKQQKLDIRADAFSSCNHLSMNRLLRERALRKAEKDRRDYIMFLRGRRKVLQKGRIGPQPNTPYWLWEECWKRRDSIIQDSLVEILKSVKAVEPDVDLAKLAKGTVEHMKSPKLQGTRFDMQIVLDSPTARNVDRLEGYLKRFGSVGGTPDGKTALGSSAEARDSQAGKGIHGGDEFDDVFEEKVVDEEIDGLPLPKPLGYYFRNVVSFDKFEEEFEKFNLESFGTKEYGVRVGQLVKGTVEDVKPKRLLVDIHTSKLAVMRLSDFFSTPKEVPSGGFTAIFKKGDEMYFEVMSKYGNDIRVSTRRIQEMYKCRDIYRKHFNHQIFRVRAIQRYTMGVLVQYQGEEIADIKGYQCPVPVDELENVAFVPYRELDRQYRSEVQRIRLDVVGKVMAVYIADWALCNGVPLVSNIEAVRRLPLAHMKTGDIIRANKCMYGKEAVWLHLGHTIGTLSVADMNVRDYEKHIRGDKGVMEAKVKSVNLVSSARSSGRRKCAQVAGTMELTTRGFDSLRIGAAVNEWAERMKGDPDVVNTFNKAVVGETSALQEVVAGAVEAAATNLNPIHRVPKMRLTTSTVPSLPQGKMEEGGRSWDGIRWDFTPTAPAHDEQEEERHAYNQFQWEVLTEGGWANLSPAEQRVLNRARFQHDEVVYYQHEGRSYRADLVEMVRQNLTDFVQQPLRNDCYVALDEDELREGLGLDSTDGAHQVPLGAALNFDGRFAAQQRGVQRHQYLHVRLGVADGLAPLVVQVGEPHGQCAVHVDAVALVGQERTRDVARPRLGHLVLVRLHIGGGGAGPRVKLGNVHDRQLQTLQERQSGAVVVLGFGGEAADDVGRKRALRQGLAHAAHEGLKLGDVVLPVHQVQHAVAAGLDGEMKELEDVVVPEDLDDVGDVPLDVRRVGHAQTEHHVGGVLRGEPDLLDALGDHGFDAVKNRLHAVAAQDAAGMLGLAECAGAQAARGERDDLDQLVLPDLGKVQRREDVAIQQRNLAVLQSLLHDVHDFCKLLKGCKGSTVNLERYSGVLEDAQAAVGLGDAATDDDRDAQLPSPGDFGGHGVLARTLHSATVDYGDVGALELVAQRVAVLAQKTLCEEVLDTDEGDILMYSESDLL